MFLICLSRTCRVSHHPHVERISVPKIAQSPKKKETKRTEQKKLIGCHIIPTLKGISTRDSFRFSSNMPRFKRALRKEMRILRFHLILPFPCELRSTVRVPTDFNDADFTPTEATNLVVENLDRFLHNAKMIINLDLLQWYNERFISQTLLQVRHMEDVLHITELRR